MFGATMIRASLPNYRAIVEAETAQEARFKNAHQRVRTHAESIAFFGGGDREHHLASTEFEGVLELEYSRLRANFFFGLVSHAVVREAPMLVQWLLRNAYGLSFGADAIGKDGEKMVAINSGQVCLPSDLETERSLVGRVTNIVHHMHRSDSGCHL